MRRLLAIATLLLVATWLVALPATGADDGPYEVRAVFDNGSFIVPDEEVRIAGARVGSIDSVSVSDDEEIVSLENGGIAIPGKAVIVMTITDDAFKDFREDASCIVRPQSLIGERFVDCTPTEPRAPGSEAPPELEQIPDGEPGEGQRLLPLERNGKTVDLDLINNISRAPYRDRFRLILNDLGAGLAARGDDLGDIVDRANPALRQTNRVVKILAGQNDQLASLASDGDEVLQPLADNRTSITGFFHNAAISGQAAAERSDDIEAGLQKFPGALRELTTTMRDLRAFADQGTPLAQDIGASAKDLSKATQKLAPFARNGVPALRSLGNAAEVAGPRLAAADPALVDLASFARGSKPVGINFGALLDTFEQTNGFRYLMSFIYNSVGSINGFDSFGRYLRSNLQVSNCIDISSIVVAGCEAFFQQVAAPSSAAKKKSAGASAQGKVAPAPAPSAQQPEQQSEPPLLPPIEELLPELSPPAPGDEPTAPGADEGDDDGDEVSPRGAALSRGYGEPMDLEDASVFLAYLLGSGS